MHHDPIARVAGWLLEPEPLTVPRLLTADEIAAFKAQWDALKTAVGGGWIDSRTGVCLACGCLERTQSHCDRWDCRTVSSLERVPLLLPDRSSEAR